MQKLARSMFILQLGLQWWAFLHYQHAFADSDAKSVGYFEKLRTQRWQDPSEAKNIGLSYYSFIPEALIGAVGAVVGSLSGLALAIPVGIFVTTKQTTERYFGDEQSDFQSSFSEAFDNGVVSSLITIPMSAFYGLGISLYPYLKVKEWLTQTDS